MGSCPPQILFGLYWRLAPFPFTGRGWKLRSSSQRSTWRFEKRTFDSIRMYGMYVCINRLHANLKGLRQILRREYLRQTREGRKE